MEDLPDRRRFLQLAGTGAAASVAGCTSLGMNQDGPGESDDGNDTNESDGPEGTDEDVDTSDIPDGAVTAAVQPDEDALTELQEDLNQRVEDGDIDQQQAAREYQEGQLELLEEATTDFESFADENEDISVVDTIPEAGVILVEGDANALLEGLNDDEMNALLSGETFAMVRQQQQMQEQFQQQAEGEGNDTEAEGDDGGNETATEGGENENETGE